MQTCTILTPWRAVRPLHPALCPRAAPGLGKVCVGGEEHGSQGRQDQGQEQAGGGLQAREEQGGQEGGALARKHRHLVQRQGHLAARAEPGPRQEQGQGRRGAHQARAEPGGAAGAERALQRKGRQAPRGAQHTQVYIRLAPTRAAWRQRGGTFSTVCARGARGRAHCARRRAAKPSEQGPRRGKMPRGGCHCNAFRLSCVCARGRGGWWC